jgi:hypothetical protein
MFYKLFEEWALGGRPVLLKANGKAFGGLPPVPAARAGLAGRLRLPQGKEE